MVFLSEVDFNALRFMVKKRVSTAVQFCFCDAAFMELGNRCNDTS